MFELLKSKLFSYFFFNFSEYSYRQVYKEAGEETVYYKNGKVVVFVEDTELGQKIYELVKRLKENEQVISTYFMNFQITSYYLSSENTLQAFCAHTNWNEEWSEGKEWEDVSSLEKLKELVSFIQKMEGEYGYTLNPSKFRKQTCKQLATFLSFFDIEPEEKKSSKGYLIEYIHYVLSGGGNLQEDYQELLKKDLIPVTSFPYHQPIIQICYQYFTKGIVPISISEVLERERVSQSYKTFRSYYIANSEILRKQREVVEETESYVVYKENCKIYKNITNGFADFLQNILKFSDNYEDYVAEHVLSEIKDFDGNVIGYHFGKVAPVRKALSFSQASDIFEQIRDQSLFIVALRKRLDADERGQEITGFCFETDLFFGNNCIGVQTFENLFNLKNISVEALKKQITVVFLKRYTQVLQEKYGALTEENEFWEKWEVRNLSPILANAIINYALGKKVNLCMAASNLDTIFTQNVLIVERSGYFYDRKLEYHPKKVPFLFEEEAEKKYALPVERGTQKELPDNRQFVILERRTNIANLKKQIDKKHSDLRQRFGDIEYKYLQIATISEVIYSKELCSNGTYCVAGYITTPIKGKRLTKEVLLGLNNKEMYYLIGHLVAKLGTYQIPFEAIWMDERFVCYINPFDPNFRIEVVREANSPNRFIDELKKQGYNPNAFYGINRMQGWHELADKCNKYCKEHGIYYEGKKGLCPVCQETKAIVFLKLAKKLWGDESATYYELPNGYKVKAYKRNLTDKAVREKNIDEMIARRLDSNLEIGQECFVPYKKAISVQNKLIGYIYKAGVRAGSLEDSEGCIDITQTVMMKNLPRLKSLIRLMLQVQELVMHGWSFVKNPFVHEISKGETNPVGHVFLSKGHKRQVQILNIDLLSRTGNTQDTFKWTCEYVCLTLALDPNIQLDTSDCKEDFQALLNKMRALEQELTKYCPIHHMYYSKKHLFCPKCIPEEKENLVVERVSKEKLTKQKPIGEGGESIIYPYGETSVAKVFREGVVDQNFKNSVLVRVMNKREILEELDAKNGKFQYVIPQKLLVDEKTDSVFAYVMRRVSGMPLSNLRDQKEVERLGFTKKDVLEILIAVGEGIEALHQNGIFIGDLNGRNILFDENKIVYFLEFDGMGIDEIKPAFCTDGYIDPISKKTKNITMKDDWYSFAIQSFYYLTYTHPFNGLYITKIGEKEVTLDIPAKMERRISLLGNHGMKPPAIARSWEWMEKELLKAFFAIFECESRQSILPYLKNEYQKEIGLEGGRINTKFIATKLQPFVREPINRVVNEHAVVFCNKGDYHIAMLGQDTNQVSEVVMSLADYTHFLDVLFLEDKKTAWIVFDYAIVAANLSNERIFYQEDKLELKYAVTSGNTLYFVAVSDGEEVIQQRTILENGEVKKERIKFLPTQKTKGFLVKFNSKFVVVKQGQKGEDEIYCNSQKFCNIQYNSASCKYSVLYDDISESWLVINSDGYAVVIFANGNHQKITIPGNMRGQLWNANYHKRTIYIPGKEQLHIIQIGKEEIKTKTMECRNIMAFSSKLYNINPEGFSVITDNTLYEVRRG